MNLKALRMIAEYNKNFRDTVPPRPSGQLVYNNGASQRGTPPKAGLEKVGRMWRRRIVAPKKTCTESSRRRGTQEPLRCFPLLPATPTAVAVAVVVVAIECRKDDVLRIDMKDLGKLVRTPW